MKKRIALIAHDEKKKDMVEWALHNKEILAKHDLCGTGTTGKLVSDALEIPVKRYKSVSAGGDQQIGSRIVEGKIDVVIFFTDPLTTQPHDVDVKALLRIVVLQNIPIACNRASADFIITSKLF